jgi:hypothetical protein
MFKLSKRFIAVCAGIIHIVYLLLFVWIKLSENNPLNKGCQSHFSYNLKHHLAFPPTRHHRCKGCKKCCSLAFISLTCKLVWGGYCNYAPIMTSKRTSPITNTTLMIIIISILFSFIANLLLERACYFQNKKRPLSNQALDGWWGQEPQASGRLRGPAFLMFLQGRNSAKYENRWKNDLITIS